MNLIGNAVKFTANGYVRVVCSVDRSRLAPEGSVFLKFVIMLVQKLHCRWLWAHGKFLRTEILGLASHVQTLSCYSFHFSKRTTHRLGSLEEPG